jgi:hypothetical protein
MEPAGVLTPSPYPTTSPHPKPDEYNAHPPYFLKIHSNIISHYV